MEEEEEEEKRKEEKKKEEDHKYGYMSSFVWKLWEYGSLVLDYKV